MLQKCAQNIERECHDENVFLKADKALSDLNFLFHSKSKTNLITLIKLRSHLQYYKIDSSISMKLQEIMYVVVQTLKMLNAPAGKMR